MDMGSYSGALRLPVAVLIALTAFVFVANAAGGTPAASSILVPKGAELRNPVTEIAVGFGDVSHVSPWRVRRRFPRSGGPRSGELVTLRDALRAINAEVAKDEEMPESTFAFDADGRLVSVCDVLFGPQPDGAAICVRTYGEGGERHDSLTPDMLDKPVRDFSKVEFARSGLASNAPAEGAASVRKTGTVKTVELPGGAKMELIWCGPGTFKMGSPVDEEGRFADEPLHSVTLTKGFWLGKYEVTQAQWASVMGNNPSRFKNPNNPVENVSWDDCQLFIRKVNTALGGAARLPTEAEWEYACRAGSGDAVAGSGLLDEMAWYDANSGKRPHEVGRNSANAWGFLDMHGNVLEWCSDWFSKLGDQSVDPKGAPSGSFKVLRGGCWFFYARDCRSAYRLKREPTLRNCIYGFRLACSEK